MSLSSRYLFSTKEMYEELGPQGSRHQRHQADRRRIPDQNPAQIARNLYNVFEGPAIRRAPEIGKLKQRLRQLGALGAQMTGSGSAVFGLFDNLEPAAAACEALRETYGKHLPCHQR